MDIRTTNRWEGFSTEEIQSIYSMATIAMPFFVCKSEEMRNLLNDMKAELARRYLYKYEWHGALEGYSDELECEERGESAAEETV